MTDLPPDFPDGLPDPRDRSEQAARFLDLTRRHQELMAGGRDELLAALVEAGDLPDPVARPIQVRDEIDGPVFPPPTTPRVVTLVDGDVFGDGNGFGSGALDTNPFD